ncbi:MULTISPECIES: FxLD family lanthipeptide [Streptomyces]|uniref:FxLD family lantipeptide n=1 Tax=Streptomyces aidingensis TaxID=910347 RepID=A0A1I1SFY0_9ACTN|nr:MULTISPECIES: FxLD family lanthipeptide [Streptomyces]SFD42753.1 FxLD family lantipeptide [Streptomyces aidingensis]
MSNVPVQNGISPSSPSGDGFDLDVALLEVGDVAGLTNLTDDNCGTTCGACTTNVA